jgi:hypothetical protein
MTRYVEQLYRRWREAATSATWAARREDIDATERHSLLVIARVEIVGLGAMCHVAIHELARAIERDDEPPMSQQLQTLIVATKERVEAAALELQEAIA